MGLLRALRRSALLITAAAVAGYVLRRQGILPVAPRPALSWPPRPWGDTPAAPRDPAAEPAHEPPLQATVELVADPSPAPAAARDEATEELAATVELPALQEEALVDWAAPPPPPQADEGSDVTAVVDDLLSWVPDAGEEVRIVDAEVVEDEPAPRDEALAEAVLVALAEQPGLLGGAVDVMVIGGTVVLSGEIHRPDAIEQLERRAGAVPGVRRVRNLLHVAGAPARAAGLRR